MAEIVPFVKRAPSAPRSRRSGSGEIVFFLGVRVEYHDAAATKRTKPRPRRGKQTSPETVLSA